MFLGLSGPASTGKTTIYEALKAPLLEFAAKKGLNVSFLVERAREVFANEFALEFETLEAMFNTAPLRYQLRLSEAFLEDAFQARNKNDLVISDRVGLDVLVYTNIQIARGFRDLALEEAIFENLKISMLKVDKIFMTRPFGTVEADGFRPQQYADPAMRAYEENLFNVLGGTYPNTIWLPEGCEERIDIIMSTIQSYY